MREASITLNRNSVPFDPNGAWYVSGLRLGTPALTTLGMGTSEMKEIASIIKSVLAATQPAKITRGRNAGSLSKARYRTDSEVLDTARSRVAELLRDYVVYPELDLEYLQKAFR